MSMSPFVSDAFSAVVGPYAPHVPYGEAVLVMPRQSCLVDDRVFASHATFTWRTATTVVPRPGGGALRYTSHRSVAAFTAADLPSGLAVGDRITRSWDGVSFEIVGLFREGGALCCELRESSSRTH